MLLRRMPQKTRGIHAALLKNRGVSSWQQCWSTIDTLNEQVNAFVAVQNKSFLEKRASSTMENGVNGPLHAFPLAVKDNFCTASLPTTCGSKMLKDFHSPFDATVVRLLQDAGALVLGKTNMDEFGMGSANVFSEFGPTLNPHELSTKGKQTEQKRVAGGSSGGSAAAVAMDMCRAALGSDTGGSVRLPAAYCGVIGFKPSYGRCSRFGLVAYANSLDTVGIMARDMQDVSLVFDVINKHDGQDPTSMLPTLRAHVDDKSQALASKWSTDDLSGLRVGIPHEYFVESLSTDATMTWRKGIRHLKSKGATIHPISLPHTELALSAYYIIALAEASSNLARYDGVRYGHRSKAAPRPGDDLIYADTRAEGFGTEVKRRILLGTHVLTAGTYEKYFLPAQKVRRLIQQDFDQVFLPPSPLLKTPPTTKEGVHVVLAPSAVSSAPSIGDVLNHTCATNAYLNDVMTVPASLAGLPAISVPYGSSPTDGYPLGLQMIGPYGYDQFLLRIAEVLQRAA